MLKNLPLMSMSISDILEIDVVVIISLVLHINFFKIHTNSEVVLSMTLLFNRMFSFMKNFH